MKWPRNKSALFLLGLLVVSAGIWGVSIRVAKLKEFRAANEFTRDQIESRTAWTNLPVLLLRGTVNTHNFDKRDHQKDTTHDFELVMRGLTNYFMKETWGAKRGEHSFFGGQKEGGFAVVLRTVNFSGQWQQGWSGTRGGGGGGGFEQFQDDLLPGRWLWSRSGFVGAQGKYESHQTVRHNYSSHLEWHEEYRGCASNGGVLVPRTIIWTKYWAVNADGELVPHEQRVFKISSFQFQTDPDEKWFAARASEYFSDSIRFKTTNSPNATATTNRLTSE